jgi:bifunctional enzyme CysN/CysC
MKQLTITAVGHVDHGKSTLLGRLLHDTGSIPGERIRAVAERCAEMGRPFEYAFLLDALQEEQIKNITIDLSRFQFSGRSRSFVLIDAPGHKEFLKTMVSGAASADAVVLLVDALEGMRDQTRRHAYLLGLLDVRQVVVAVNKMDKVGYSRETFERVRREVEDYLGALGLAAAATVPVAAAHGANVARRSADLSWYPGPTLLDELERLVPRKNAEALPFRFPVQDVYRQGDRQVAVGRLESGTLHEGESVSFWPSGVEITAEFVHAPESRMRERFRAGHSIALLLPAGVALVRGEIGAPRDAAPRVGKELKLSLFWLGRKPLTRDARYILRLATVETAVTVRDIRKVIRTESLASETRDLTSVAHSEVAEIVLESECDVPYDFFSDLPSTGRVVLIDELNVAGGGIICPN